MSYIVPHTCTLIIDIGSGTSKIGYCGDFKPSFVVPTVSLCPNTSNKNSYERICQSIEDILKQSSFTADSMILIEDPSNRNRSKILQFLFTNNVCNSVYFLSAPLADLFGFGKVSGTVLTCSASHASVHTIINGRIVEDYYCNDLVGELSSHFNQAIEQGDVIIPDSAFSKIDDLVGKAVNLRSKHSINKKNTANGCIVLCGGLMRFESFYDGIKRAILSRIGEDFADFVLREKELNTVFAGASIFGANNHSKALFITAHDWKSVGSEILKMKCSH